MKILSKGLVLIIALTIIGAVALPTDAKAQVPIWEENVAVIESGLTTALSTAKDLVQNLYEWAQALLGERLRRQLLNMLVDQMVGFINDGELRVVSDWEDFLYDAGVDASEQFANQVAGADLCPEFAPHLRAALGATGATGSPGGLLDCTKTPYPPGTTGLGAFYDSLEPENSFISSYVMAKNAQMNAKAAAEHAAELEAVTGGGFLSDKQSGIIVTPGSVIKDLASKSLGSEIDYVLNADDLESYVNAVVNSMFNDVLAKGLVNVSPQKDDPIDTGIDAGDWVTGAGTLGTISKNKFNDEKRQLRKSIDKAIKDRKAGQAFWPDHDQCDDHDHQHFPETEIKHIVVRGLVLEAERFTCCLLFLPSFLQIGHPWFHSCFLLFEGLQPHLCHRCCLSWTF